MNDAIDRADPDGVDLWAELPKRHSPQLEQVAIVPLRPDS